MAANPTGRIQGSVKKEGLGRMLAGTTIVWFPLGLLGSPITSANTMADDVFDNLNGPHLWQIR